MYLIIEVDDIHKIFSEDDMKDYCIKQLLDNNIDSIIITRDDEDFEIFLLDENDLEVEELIAELMKIDDDILKIFKGDNIVLENEKLNEF